jgi:hypothetical protein
MASKFGAKRGMPDYDHFRTGFTYAQVYEMMKDYSADPKDWRYKKRGSVLGFWHQLKMELWEQYLAEREAQADGGES